MVTHTGRRKSYGDISGPSTMKRDPPKVKLKNVMLPAFKCLRFRSSCSGALQRWTPFWQVAMALTFQWLPQQKQKLLCTEQIKFQTKKIPAQICAQNGRIVKQKKSAALILHLSYPHFSMWTLFEYATDTSKFEGCNKPQMGTICNKY